MPNGVIARRPMPTEGRMSLLVTLLNACKPLTVDDPDYYSFALHIAEKPAEIAGIKPVVIGRRTLLVEVRDRLVELLFVTEVEPHGGFQDLIWIFVSDAFCLREECGFSLCEGVRRDAER